MPKYIKFNRIWNLYSNWSCCSICWLILFTLVRKNATIKIFLKGPFVVISYLISGLYNYDRKANNFFNKFIFFIGFACLLSGFNLLQIEI